ncbi:MAG: vWA domain-containing protein, partial [Pirellulales bacterium]
TVFVDKLAPTFAVSAAGGADFVDGQVLTVTDSQDRILKLEFDNDDTVTNPRHAPIPFDADTTATDLVQALVDAINNAADFSVRAFALGARIALDGERDLQLSAGFTSITLVDPATAGPLDNPFDNIPEALDAANSGDIVRIVGNGDADSSTETLAYEIGFRTSSDSGAVLTDGGTFEVKRGVTVMVDGGAVFKLRDTAIQIGSTAPEIDRSGAALQVLGTPESNVVFTSFSDPSIGATTDPNDQLPDPGDWGGLAFYNDLDRAAGRFDYEDQGIFLNYVNQADIRYAGGQVNVASILQVITPIDMRDARPTISFNTITRSADAAMSATPNSFAETNFQAPKFQSEPFTSDYDRVGPDIHGNRVLDNSTNGLFVRILTPAGDKLRRLTVSGRWDDADIVHVVSENLLIEGTPGGPLAGAAGGAPLEARLDARLAVDPGVVVKLDGARIETRMSAQLIAEGLDGQEVVFTSSLDDRFGAGGTFDTTNDGDASVPRPGDWGGLLIGPVSTASIDHAILAFGGGVVPIEGSFAAFNVVEIHQAEARITHSVFENNAAGIGGQATDNRVSRGFNAPGAIFVRGAQPVIVGNIIRDTTSGSAQDGEAPGNNKDRAAAININANSLNHVLVADYGRSTGTVDLADKIANNQGPLIRGNLLENNDVNGMVVRGATLTTQGVWDDTDITYVVFEEIIVPDFHTFGGLRLESASTESLVVKLAGDKAGFTALGRPLDIDDRIGGSLQIVGQPGFPVVLTSVNDCTASAGFTPDGRPQNDALNSGSCDVALGDAITADVAFADVIVVIDESGTMAAEQDFSEQFIVDLDAALVAAGIGDGSQGSNRFGLVGFGGSTPEQVGHAHQVGPGNALFGTAAEYVTAAQTLVVNGAIEDGYSGIQFALDNYQLRPDAAKFIILATDEDRDVVDATLDFNTTLAGLQAANVNLQAIVNATYVDVNGTLALGIDKDGTAFLPAGAAGFTTSTGGVVQFVPAEAGTTEADYIDLAFATGGLAGDITQIDASPEAATSFGKALIQSIVVQAGGRLSKGAPGDWRSIRLDALSLSAS